MRLEWLEDILAVAQTGSFSEAAERTSPDAIGLFAPNPEIEEHVGVRAV